LVEDSIHGLLREIRDLLLPISAHYLPEYRKDQAQLRRDLQAKVADMVASPKRRAAWNLIDGTRSQREISKRSTLDEGSTSRLFKSLRELGAIVDAPNPTKTLEID
jgi:hypothetical protein